MIRFTSLHVVVMVACLNAAACGKSADASPAADTAKPAAAAPASTPAAATTQAAAAPAPTQAAPAPAGETFHWENHKPSGMKFELPTSWSTGQKGDVLVAKGPGVGIEFVGVTSGLAAKNDERAMMAEVGKVLQGAKITTKPKAVEQHGGKGFVFTGTGKRDGNEVEWFSVLLAGKAGGILALGFYAPGIAPNVKAEMVRVLDSIQPS